MLLIIIYFTIGFFCALMLNPDQDDIQPMRLLMFVVWPLFMFLLWPELKKERYEHKHPQEHDGPVNGAMSSSSDDIYYKRKSNGA